MPEAAPAYAATLGIAGALGEVRAWYQPGYQTEQNSTNLSRAHIANHACQRCTERSRTTS
jgi:hypothetical protein